MFMRRALLAISLVAALAVAIQLIAAPGQIASGPFVVGVPGKTATIAWLARNGDPAFRVETTSLESLEPNTRYEYNISSLGEAGKGSFKTPPSGTEPFRFVAYGD